MALLVNCLNISTNTSYITLNLFKIQEVILQEQSMDSVDERYDIPFKIKKSTIVKLVPSTLELKKIPQSGYHTSHYDPSSTVRCWMKVEYLPDQKRTHNGSPKLSEATSIVPFKGSWSTKISSTTQKVMRIQNEDGLELLLIWPPKYIGPDKRVENSTVSSQKMIMVPTN